MELPFDDVAVFLVIGIGDVRRRDAGIGPRVVEGLVRLYDLPDEVEVVAVKEPGPDLLDALEGADRVLVVDVALGGEPGAVFQVPLDDYEREEEPPPSLHESALLEALGVLEMTGKRPRAVLLAVRAAETGDGEDLSPLLNERVPTYVAQVARIMEDMGARPSLRQP